jgi:acetyl-CoA C-acetyltransferase
MEFVMRKPGSLAPNTPVLVGAGQVVHREADRSSPMSLAAEAARAALLHSGSGEMAAAIDTICVTRLFTDSMGYRPCTFGRSNNPPMSVASAIGATPDNCIYSQVGGNDPQSRVIEFARDIACGNRSAVLLAGGEAAYNLRTAEQSGESLDWSEQYEQPLEDRGWGDLFVSEQEIANGLLAPIFYYALIEQARVGRGDGSQYRETMASLFAGLSEVAAANPYAQFPRALSPREILDGPRLNHLYSKGMVARDSVNLGAAILLCSVERARSLGIPEQNWVFIHAQAEGEDVNLSQREDPGRSAMMKRVFERVLDQARLPGRSPDLIDLYNCFPCAVSAAAEVLDLPASDPSALTLTGGLPFFGGPGNNYVMHSLAEAVTRLRNAPAAYAMVTAVGGVLSKHAAGIYSCQPSDMDWREVETTIDRNLVPKMLIETGPTEGKLVSYVVNYRREQPYQAMILGETATRRRFVAVTEHGDTHTVAVLSAGNPVGRRIQVTPGGEGKLHFRLHS